MYIKTKDIISLLSKLKETDIYKNSNLLGQKPDLAPNNINNSDLLYALLCNLEKDLDKLNPKINEFIELEFIIKIKENKERTNRVDKCEVFKIPEDLFVELKK